MSHNQNQSLINALRNCAVECNHCATACLDEQDVKMLSTCIKLDIDCAEICTIAAGFVARGSTHAGHILSECAEICNACAEECEKHAQHGMQHCKDCAEACRKCAEACAQMQHA
jgi:hypothetical protein